MQISISDLRLYLQCPRSFKIHEIDGVDPFYKSISYCKNIAVRKAIQEIHHISQNPSELTQDQIFDICQKIWYEEISDEKVNQEELESIVSKEKKSTRNRPGTPAITKKEKILEAIVQWCFEYTRESKFPLYNNVYFQTVIGDITFCGYIPQVNTPEEITILSTSSNCPHPEYIEKDFVISLFAHACWQGNLYPEYPNMENALHLRTIPSISILYLPYLERYKKKSSHFKKGDRKGNPVIPVSRTTEMLLDFEYEILYLTSGMEQGFFPMMPTSIAKCSLCQYSHVCANNTSHFNVQYQESKEVMV